MDPQPPRRSTHVSGSPNGLIVYDRWGEFGRPVLLLHGLLFDRTMWWPVAAELGTACTVIAPDLPGHGQSPVRADCAPEQIAADLAGLVHNLGLHRAPIVVGHGTSARLADVFAASYAVHALVSVDESTAGLATVDDVVTAAGLSRVPEPYRPFAEPKRDPDLLRAYESLLGPGPGGARRSATFTPLADPAEFAAGLRVLL
jgi:pimeloyl-ACP methyl ester carboxylesterase